MYPGDLLLQNPVKYVCACTEHLEILRPIHVMQSGRAFTPVLAAYIHETFARYGVAGPSLRWLLATIIPAMQAQPLESLEGYIEASTKSKHFHAFQEFRKEYAQRPDLA